MLRFGFFGSCLGLLDVGGIDSLGVHTCCERAFVRWLFRSAFFSLLGGILMMMRLGGTVVLLLLVCAGS